MIIRGLTSTDFQHIVSVLDAWWGGPSNERALPMFFHELGHHGLVAEEDGRLTGFLVGLVTDVAPKTGYVHLVGIHPEHRRSGVGRALYARFSECSKESGATRLKAIAHVGHEGARVFHAGLGFEAEEVADYAGPGRGRMVFTRAL